MKNLIILIAVYLALFLTVFSVLFVIGCQENTITDPVFTEFTDTQSATTVTANKNLLPDYKDYQDFIKFKRVLNLANLPNTYFIVAGIIKVELKTLNPNPEPQNGKYSTNVNLAIDAEMKEMEYGIDCWYIRYNTQNTVYLARGEAISIIKYYKIEERCDGMLLACKFKVALDGVALQEMWITFSKVHSANCVAQ